MFPKRDLQYYFPFVVPILLTFSDFFIQKLVFDAQKCPEEIIVEISVMILFSFFTIDIWGLTISFKKNSDLTLMWTFLMICHLTLYGAARYLQNLSLEKVNMQISVPQIFLWILLVLIGVAFTIFLLAREKLWRTMNV